MLCRFVLSLDHVTPPSPEAWTRVLGHAVALGLHLHHAPLRFRSQSRPGKTRLASNAVRVFRCHPQIDVVHIVPSLKANAFAGRLVVDVSSIRLKENIISLVRHGRDAHKRGVRPHPPGSTSFPDCLRSLQYLRTAVPDLGFAYRWPTCTILLFATSQTRRL